MNIEDLSLPSPDGHVPVRLFKPTGPVANAQPRGGVIFYMDAFGLRPELDAMCQRYADIGYVTFLPDLYWRKGKIRFPPLLGPDDPLDPEMDLASRTTTLKMSISDTGAIVQYVHQSPQLGVHRFGAVGHCMGARHALAALAVYPQIVGAAACLHGGMMVGNTETSPHLYIPRIRGAAYFAFAENDPTCPDAHKTVIEDTIRTSGVRAQTEHYAANHGWTFPERWCYDPVAATNVWNKVVDLFKTEVDTW